MKKKIAFFTKHTAAGPSSRYRSYQYKSCFEQAGYEIEYYPLFPASYLKSLYEKGKKPMLTFLYAYIRRFFQVLFLKHYDIIFIEYELFPFTPFFIENLLLKNKKNIILDYDDAVFHNYDKSPNAVIRKLLGTKIYRLVHHAEYVITGSPYLTEVLQKYARRIVEIPTSVDYDRYNEAETTAISEKTNNNFRIGWIGSKTTSPNLLFLIPALKELQKKFAVELVLIGFDKFISQELQGVNHTLYGWSEATEIPLLKTFDVGIMPLTNDIFNNGKCGFKLIQYMACGLPTVSTPLVANVKINRSGLNLHATSAEDWIAALEEVYAKKVYYSNTVGALNRQIVKEFYSVEANNKELIKIFEQLK